MPDWSLLCDWGELGSGWELFLTKTMEKNEFVCYLCFGSDQWLITESDPFFVVVVVQMDKVQNHERGCR